MTTLTDREEKILNLIVDDYIRTSTPIASESLVRNHALGVSSATIRNDVAELEQGGYITRPHPSAGSIPLDKGYRLYVETVASAQPSRISPSRRASIRRQLLEAERDIDEWTRVAAAILARLVDNMAIATSPRAREARVKHVDLVFLQDFMALLIVVFEQARLRRQLIRLKEPADRSGPGGDGEQGERHAPRIDQGADRDQRDGPLPSGERACRYDRADVEGGRPGRRSRQLPRRG